MMLAVIKIFSTGAFDGWGKTKNEVWIHPIIHFLETKRTCCCYKIQSLSLNNKNVLGKWTKCSTCAMTALHMLHNYLFYKCWIIWVTQAFETKKVTFKVAQLFEWKNACAALVPHVVQECGPCAASLYHMCRIQEGGIFHTCICLLE